MKDASYSYAWTDLQFSQHELQFTRVYHSRSRFNGMLGFGWCTPFEVSAERLDTSRIRVTECHVGDVIYKIGAAGVFTNPQRPSERIEVQRDQLRRYLPNGEKQVFAKSGKLSAWLRPGLTPLQFRYRSTGLLRDVRSGAVSLAFYFDAQTHKLAKIVGSNGKQIKFTRTGEDLSMVRGTADQIHKYEYDELHNLVLAKFPDGTTETNTYDKDLDRVLTTTDRGGCKSKFTYAPLHAAGEIGQRTEATTICPNSPLQISKAEFWWSKRADKELFLSRKREVSPQTTLETWLDPMHGQPIRIINAKGQTFHLFYDTHGRLTSVFEAARETLRLIYSNDSRKPAEVHRPGFGAIRLEYDTRGLLRALQPMRGPASVGEIASVIQNIFGQENFRGQI